VSILATALQGWGRDSFSSPSEDLIAAFSGGKTASGKSVSVQNARTLIPVWRAINLRAGAIGAMPMEVFRRTGFRRKEFAPETSRPWELLHDKSNELQAASETWKLVESHVCSWGNAFLWKERGPDGRIANLWPISPRRVQVGRDINGKPVFLVETWAATAPGSPYLNYASTVLCDDSEILHIRGLSEDGLVGFSPIQQAREALGSMMAQQEFEGKFWESDATPGVTLIHPNKLTPEGTDRLRALWDNRHKGSAKARATAVLGEGVKVEPMTIPLADAQFVEIAGLRRADVALLFGIPVYMLAGDAGGSSMQYTNSETASLDFVKWSLLDSMTTIENAVSWDPDLMPKRWFAKFNADTLLRGSQQERYQAYSTAPHLLIDEVREDEDMEPLPDGKGQVLTKTIGPPRGTTIPAQDEPLQDQPTPGPGAAPADDTTAGDTTTGDEANA
jgi:HK97 family phage portal protein